MKFIANTKMDDIQGGPVRPKEFRISKILGWKQYSLPFMIFESFRSFGQGMQIVEESGMWVRIKIKFLFNFVQF